MMRLSHNANLVECATQTYWLASSRMNDCTGDELAMSVVRDTFCDLRRNKQSATIAKLADRALQQMYSRRGAA